MSTINKPNLWDLIDNPSEPVEYVSELVSWSMNFDYKTRPYLIFLDLIGYSMEEYGEPLTNAKDYMLGYMEHDLIGKALIEYATNPQAVLQYIADLQAAEDNE